MTILSQRPFKFSFGKQKRWVSPQDSTGVYLATIGLNKSCWEATGPARSVFDTLQDDIGNYINQTCESLSKDVVWSLYMVGRPRETAFPVITFISCEPGPRQRLRALIIESTILEKHPGFITMDIDRPPGCKSSVIMTLGGLDESSSDSNQSPPQQISISVPSNNLMGSSIYLPGRGSNLVATGGCLVQFKEKLFMTSVAHPFKTGWNDRFPETAPPGDYVFDIDEIDDHEEDETMVHLTSSGSITSNSNSYCGNDQTLSVERDSWSDSSDLLEEQSGTTNLITDVSPISTKLHAAPSTVQNNNQRSGDIMDDPVNSDGDGIFRQAIKTYSQQMSRVTTNASNTTASGNLPLTFDLTGPTISSAKGGTTGLDYSLFQLPNSILQRLDSTIVDNSVQKHPTSVSRNARSTQVVVHAFSGPIAGRLLATSSVMQPAESMSPQKLWTVIMEGTLQRRICGSLVVDVFSGDVFGHIIAGAPEDGFAYVVPFYEVLDDLNLHFGDGWSLVDSGKVSTEDSLGEVTLSPGRNCSLPQGSKNLPEGLGSDLDMALTSLVSETCVVWNRESSNLDSDEEGSPKQEFSSCTPVFRAKHGQLPHYDFDQNIILPFRKDYEHDAMQCRSGGHSRVWPVRIVTEDQSDIRKFMEGFVGDEETLPYPDQVEKVVDFFGARELYRIQEACGVAH
ncbi:hypothetical protein DL95DRAFT_415189 [Leptodontidium sp. 2 PMI_412]|nr:hypothetical protein DL95DRAFT_415189 [Leptodontidium sp. 2 PMI_412]